jgi:hypothetical protein
MLAAKQPDANIFAGYARLTLWPDTIRQPALAARLGLSCSFKTRYSKNDMGPVARSLLVNVRPARAKTKKPAEGRYDGDNVTGTRQAAEARRFQEAAAVCKCSLSLRCTPEGVGAYGTC